MQITLRKALALLSCLAMLCTVLPMSALLVSAETTPVLDMNFNDGTVGFTSGSVVAEGPDGSNCLLWEASGSYSATYVYVSGVEANTDYVITFKAKASVAGSMGITIQNGGWGDYYQEKFTTTTEWTEYSITTNVGTLPTSAGKILFKFQDQGLAMSLWVDDLVMAVKEDESATVENVVTNGDFETGDTTGWTVHQSTAISADAAYSGNYGINLVGGGGWGGMLNQTLYVDDGGTYTLSFWYKVVSVGFNWTLSGNSTSTKYAGGWASTTSWTQITETFTISGDTSLLLNFNGGGTGTAENIYVDDITLIKEPEPSFDGYIYNGDFEIGSMVNWTCPQTATATADAAHSGNYGAHITNPAGNYGGMINQSTVGVEAGKTYSLSMWIKVTVGYINFQIKDGSSSGTDLATKGFNSSTWTNYSVTVTPTTNVLFLNFCGGGSGTVDEAYVDDVVIVEEKDPSYDGYIYNGDFETGKSYPWSVYQSTAVSTTAAYAGTYGMLLSGVGTNYGGLLSQTINNLKVGQSYNVTMMIKVVADGVNVQIRGGSSTSLASTYRSTSNTSDWTEITLTFTADATSATLNICGSGNAGVTVTVYLDDVKCARVGGEIYPEELIRFGGASIRDVEVSSTGGTGRGLAFKFDIEAINCSKDYENKYVESSGSIVLDETEYTLVRMGSVMTNQSSVGQSASDFTLDSVNGTNVIDIPGVYLAGLTSETVSFAVRILDIPDNHAGTEVYARPYYVYIKNGEEVIVYGDIRYDNYATVSNPKSSIKILSIGNSFSKDVMKTYLYNMFQQGGYDEIVIGYLYMGGCSMPKHLYNIENNLAQYEYGKTTDGTWTSTYDVSALTALQDEEWDYVTLHASSDYIGGQTISSITLGVNSEGEKIEGINQTEYECITPLTEWIYDNAPKTSVKVDYHMIWAYSEGCDLWSYTYHNYDQMTMYNNIIAMTKQYVVPHDAIYSIIPCGTAIQNGRTSFIGDNFNEPDATAGGTDGYHLNSKYGDYTGSLTWYCHYSGDSASVMSGYKGELTEDEFNAIAEAVDNAINNWDEVTASTYTDTE